MLDARFVAAHPQVVRENLDRRGAGSDLIAALDGFTAGAERRSDLIQARDAARATRNRLSPQIGRLMKAGQREEAEGLKLQVREASAEFGRIEGELKELEDARSDLLMKIPNLLDERVPDGANEHDNVEQARWEPAGGKLAEGRAHDELAADLGWLDQPAAARMVGARFAVLRGPLARLERALINFFLDLHTGEHGYSEVMVPYIVWRSTLEGTGQLPKFEADLFKLEGQLNGQDAFLIPTAEVPVTNLYREQTLRAADLPMSFACFTPCFRSEAGSHGKDTRGLIRQHQFHKVELVKFTTAEDADAQHEALTRHAEVALEALGLPYRRTLLCAGDISANAKLCYDLEVWLPGQQAYREISSCSNFGDFQARRMGLRYRPEKRDGKKQKPQYCHTINGSGLAVGRTLVAVLENHQQPDGSVVIPEVLRPYMGGLDRIVAAG